MLSALKQNKEIYFKTNIKSQMLNNGFDFSLTGTKYIFELLYESAGNVRYMLKYFLPSVSSLADRHNIKIKTLNRDIRWSIKKNIIFDSKLIIIEQNDDTSTTKNILVWLCKFFNTY